MTKRFGILAYFISCVFTRVVSQTSYEVDVPSNYSCETALSICGSITYFANYTDFTDGGLPCIFITFTLTDSTVVDISANGTYEGGDSSTFKLSTAGPFPIGGPCPDLPCGIDDVGNTSEGWHAEELPPGVYYIYGDFSGNYPATMTINVISPSTLCLPESPCDGCLPPFSPLPGERYVLDAWVKQENSSLTAVSYTGPQMVVEAPVGTSLATFTPSGHIIDGWQLIEGEFTMPSEASTFKVSLETTTGSALFDDVRLLPADGSMKCYVYDPVNLRFVAELDERHFATFYEYDNEGKLVRVKKETEQGIKTFKETRENAPHVP
jgi:hypothetical protein